MSFSNNKPLGTLTPSSDHFEDIHIIYYLKLDNAKIALTFRDVNGYSYSDR